MIDFTKIDPVITDWVASHRLHLYTKSRDDEVRTVDIVNAKGQKCQIWIDPPDGTGTFNVHVWDYKKRRRDYAVAIDGLRSALDDAYAIAINWLNQASS